MDLYNFSPEQMRALKDLARERIEWDRRPPLLKVADLITVLVIITAIAFGIITTIVVWSNLEVFGVNITG